MTMAVAQTYIILFFSIQLLLISAGKINVNVHNIVTDDEDVYVCAHRKLRHNTYPIGFETHSKASIAHHILLYACETPNPTTLDCEVPCYSRNKILYAWARNAEPLHLPKNVSFEIGGDTGLKYLVIQVHYKNQITKPDSSGIIVHTAPNPLPKVAGVLLMSANVGVIRKHHKAVPIGMGCRLSMKSPITPFGVRVHAHTLGRNNFAYLFRPGALDKPQLVGRGSPQWPQAFYPSALHSPMRQGDYLIGYCVYDSMKRSRHTQIGATHKDEMCNIYIMYSRRREDPALTESEELICADGISVSAKLFSQLTDHIPKTAFDYLPRDRSEWQREAAQETVQSTNQEDQQQTHKRHEEVKTHTLHEDVKLDKRHKAVKTSTLQEAVKNHTLHEEVKTVVLKVQARVGQVAGVAFDSRGLLYVFHRGDRTWDDDTFDNDGRFRNAARRGPISAATVLVVNRSTGVVVRRFGKDFFYLPHGITIDAADNVWLTDVALHQVFRFDAGNMSAPALIVGTRLEPGRGRNHFCQPTNVAVQRSGAFFVADGYCNSRIVAFSPRGEFLRSWGSANGKLQVPHSLALFNDSLLCCADRERARLECFRTKDGRSLITLKGLPEFGDQLFAICPAKHLESHGTALFGVSFEMGGHAQAFLLDLLEPHIRLKWRLPPGRPHDVSVFGSDVLVGNLDGPNGVLLYRMSDAAGGAPETSLNLSRLALTSAAPKNGSEVNVGLWRENLPFVFTAVLLIPLGVIILGALIARLHRYYLRSRSRAYKNRDRAQFKSLINEDDSGSEGEMTLMDDAHIYRYGNPSPAPKNT